VPFDPLEIGPELTVNHRRRLDAEFRGDGNKFRGPNLFQWPFFRKNVHFDAENFWWPFFGPSWRRENLYFKKIPLITHF